MTPKAKTLQERFGFADPELTTPKHDAMMVWLDANVDKFVLAHIPVFDDGIQKTKKLIDRDIDQLNQRREGEVFSESSKEQLTKRIQNLDRDRELLIPSEPRIRRTWEWVVSAGRNNYAVGFVDMKVDVECDIWHYWDSYGESGAGSRTVGFPFYFEVKPSIASLGETIRQIRLYQSALDSSQGGKFFIVSPDTRFRAQLEAQGIGLLECPANL